MAERRRVVPERQNSILLRGGMRYIPAASTNNKKQEAACCRHTALAASTNQNRDGTGMQKGRDGYRLTMGGVRVERNDRHCVVYRGTRHALISAGLASPRNFPEGQRRFLWHFPRNGVNWGVRRKGGDNYCLTKLKDHRGVVEAELSAFYRTAAGAAREDTRFQRFLAQIGAPLPCVAPPARPSLAFAPGSAGQAGRASKSGLETLALATLLFGVTVYLLTRQPES
jgi:hypothetical protein